MAAALVGGVGSSMAQIAWNTSLQQGVPKDKMARVMALGSAASFGAIPLGLVLAVPLAHRYGFRVETGAGAAWMLLALLPLLVAGVRRMTLEELRAHGQDLESVQQNLPRATGPLVGRLPLPESQLLRRSRVLGSTAESPQRDRSGCRLPSSGAGGSGQSWRKASHPERRSSAMEPADASCSAPCRRIRHGPALWPCCRPTHSLSRHRARLSSGERGSTHSGF